MKSHIKSLFLIVLTLVFLTVALGVAGAAPITSAKDSMTVVVQTGPGSFDPHSNVAQSWHQTLRQVYETLVDYDVNGNLIPWLSEKWEYKDDLTLVLHLRKGVKFHNGDELKASDVMFSLKRTRDDNTPARMQVEMIDFDKSEVIDDYTLTLVTTEVYALQLPMLALPLCAIISEKVYKENDGNLSKQVVGTGPYVLKEFHAGDRSVMEGFSDYWIPGQPYVKNLTIRYITDASSRAIEAETGGADIVYSISAHDIDRLRNDPNINMVSKMGANTSKLTINQAFGPLGDIKVRQAIWYGVDIPSAVEIAFGNFGALGSGIVSPGIDGRHPDLSPWFPKRDIQKAKQLLAEAGYPNGFDVSISCNSADRMRMDFCEAIQAQLAEIGIRVTVDAQDGVSWNTGLSAGKGQLSIYGYTASTGEAGRNLFRWLPDKSEWPIFSWVNEEYYATIREALVTVDREKRHKLFYKCQEMLMENYVALPVWHNELNAALQPGVKGFWIMTSYEHHLLQYVYF